MFARQGAPTPCGPCKNAPPTLAQALNIYDSIYESAFACREGEGALSWGVLAHLADKAGLDAAQQMFLFRAVGAAENDRQKEANDKIAKTIGDKPPPSGPSRRGK